MHADADDYIKGITDNDINSKIKHRRTHNSWGSYTSPHEKLFKLIPNSRATFGEARVLNTQRTKSERFKPPSKTLKL